MTIPDWLVYKLNGDGFGYYGLSSSYFGWGDGVGAYGHMAMIISEQDLVEIRASSYIFGIELLLLSLNDNT